MVTIIGAIGWIGA